MSGDWIKMDHSTSDKPEVWRMAALLNITPEAVIGHLLRVWVWADQQSVNSNVDGSVDAYVDAPLSTVDAVARLPGVAQAMCNVGWLLVDNSRLIFPNLQAHISESAKIRALRNRRQARFRATASTSVSTSVSTSPSTKVAPREEKSIYPPTPLKGGRAHKALSTPKPKPKPKPKSKSKGNGKGKGHGATSDERITAQGIKRGIEPRPGESMEAYKLRVLAEGRRRNGK